MKILRHLLTFFFIGTSYLIACDEGYTDIDGTCYYTSDLDVLAIFAENSGMGSEYGDVIGVGTKTWDGDGRLTNWNCQDCGLSGSIPPEIGTLIELTSLYLSSNDLAGSIPSEIGNLTELTYLYLYSNKLAGSIPPEIGNLTGLTGLNLHSNDLTGSIPLEIGNLTKLTNLDLSFNDLTGSIPLEIGNLTQLTILWLGDNAFVESIPTEIGNLLHLEILSLFNNALTGTIPLEIGNLTKLTNLDLSLNDLTGSIPSEIGNLIKLTILYLNNNALTGFIPLQIENLTELSTLYLSSNELVGLIPNLFCNLPDLIDLQLSWNNFCPAYPDCLSSWEIGSQTTSSCPDCTEGEELVYDLDYTGCYNRGDLDVIRDFLSNSLGLYGNPPADLDPWKLGHQYWENGRLQTFCCTGEDISIYDPFSGLGPCYTECEYSFNKMFITENMGLLSQLDTLVLHKTYLDGIIPNTISDLVELEVLFLTGDSLTGALPENIGNLQNLKYFSILENRLDGPLPESFWNLTNLVLADLSDNLFTGEFPEIDYSEFQNLLWLDVSNNFFTGIIPEAICNMNLINYSSDDGFGFDNNNFCPPYPECVFPGNQEITLVDYYQDLDGDDLPNISAPCDSLYCAEYSPPAGECAGGVDNEENEVDLDDNCFINKIDECNICEGDGYAALCENGLCENMDCLGVCGGDALVDCFGTCGGAAFLDDCEDCSGGNSGHTENAAKDTYCGICDGDDKCIPQLKFYEPVGDIVDIRTDNIRFHFSVPVDYTEGGVEIESYDGSDIDFSINQSTADSIIELTLAVPLISGNSMTISLDPCKILSIDSLNSLGATYCLDSDGDLIPDDFQEPDIDSVMVVALMGDFDLDNQVKQNDLDTLLHYWKTNDYRYELGPFRGDAPYLQPVDFNFNQDYNIEDLMAFVQMWNWDYTNSILREMTLEPTIDYVPEYHFDKNRFSINLSTFPGEIKRIWLRVNLQNNSIEIENTASGSDFDINLYGHKEDVRIYDWIMGAISPINNRQITLLDIVSPSKDDQVFDFQYEIVGYNNETASGDMKITYHPVPEIFSIGQAYPNPFNPVTIVDYGISETTNLSIGVYDIRGRQVNLIVKNAVDPGFYNFFWDASAYSSGIYLIKFQISDMVKIQRVLLLK